MGEATARTHKATPQNSKPQITHDPCMQIRIYCWVLHCNKPTDRSTWHDACGAWGWRGLLFRVYVTKDIQSKRPPAKAHTYSNVSLQLVYSTSTVPGTRYHTDTSSHHPVYLPEDYYTVVPEYLRPTFVYSSSSTSLSTSRESSLVE